MLEDKITRAKELMAQRETIDTELRALFVGEVKKTINCSTCHQPGHSSRRCPQKEYDGK